MSNLKWSNMLRHSFVINFLWTNQKKVVEASLFLYFFFFFLFIFYFLKVIVKSDMAVISCISLVVWFRGCLVCVFKQLFSVFKQHFTYFNAFFHSHVFSQMFSNNNFQFLNTYTKRALTIWDFFFFFFYWV